MPCFRGSASPMHVGAASCASGRSRRRPHVDDPRLAGAIVEGYGALTDEERRAVTLFFDARLLSHASWMTFYWSMGAAQRSQRDVLAELDETLDRLGTCGA